MTAQRIAILCAALLAWMFTGVVHAGSFGVDPLRLTFSPGVESLSLSLTNPGDQPLRLRATVLAWSQKDGAEVLDPSGDLVVTPSEVVLAPGAVQSVRVVTTRPNDTAAELAYRLYVEEVPPPRPAEARSFVLALRLSLPVFVLPHAPSAPLPVWSASVITEGAILLSLSNSGNAHIQAIDCRFYDADDALIAEGTLGGYVLPGQTRSWAIRTSMTSRGGRLRLSARTDAGILSALVEAP